MVISWSQYLFSSPEAPQVTSQYMFFQWAQLKHVILAMWKTLISNYSGIDEKSLYQKQYIIKGARILFIDKLSSKEIYLILFSNIVNKRT